MKHPFLPRRSARVSGFSLVEVMIALVLVGVALLMGMGLALQQPRIVKRLDAERQAFRAMESSLESVRAGLIPLKSSEHSGFVTAVGTPAPKDLQIQMQVDSTAKPGLFEVTLRSTYKVEGRRVDKVLRTMVWSPPS